MSASAETNRPLWVSCLDPDEQDAGHYLDFVNDALLEVVAAPPRRVLDLGCAGGSLGERIKQKYPGAHVTGIEMGRAAAAKAATRLDRVVTASIEDVDFAGLGAEKFDLVIAADVLEHLVNPWAALSRVRPCIAAGGHLVASIPNIRNLWLGTTLFLDGRWRYEDRGLLDITHLRFFTLTDIRKLFEETGYVVEESRARLMKQLAKLHQDNAGKEAVTVRVGRLQLEALSQQELTELCTEQYLVRARPA